MDSIVVPPSKTAYLYFFECATERIHDLKRAMTLLEENYMGEGNAAFSALFSKYEDELGNLKELADYLGDVAVAALTDKAKAHGIDVAAMLEAARA